MHFRAEGLIITKHNVVNFHIDYFVTYFTRDFLILGLTSLRRFFRYHPSAAGYIFCFDEFSRERIREAFPDNSLSVVNVHSHNDLNEEFEELLEDRNPLEVITSMKPRFIIEAMGKVPDKSFVVYLDPDIMTFSPIEISDSSLGADFYVFAQLGIPKSAQKLYGRFNAGLLIIKKTPISMKMLRTWYRLCQEWCLLKVEEEKYADQKYLDEISLSSGFFPLIDWGNNLSVRAFLKTEPSIRLYQEDENVYVNSTKLQTFHFHGLRSTEFGVITGLNRFGAIRGKVKLFKTIYIPILKDLSHESQILGSCISNRSNVGTFDKTLVYFFRKSPYVNNWIRNTWRLIRLTQIPWAFLKVLGNGERV